MLGLVLSVCVGHCVCTLFMHFYFIRQARRKPSSVGGRTSPPRKNLRLHLVQPWSEIATVWQLVAKPRYIFEANLRFGISCYLMNCKEWVWLNMLLHFSHTHILSFYRILIGLEHGVFIWQPPHLPHLLQQHWWKWNAKLNRDKGKDSNEDLFAELNEAQQPVFFWGQRLSWNFSNDGLYSRNMLGQQLYSPT